MSSPDTSDIPMRGRLAALAAELSEVTQAIEVAIQGGGALPWPLQDVFARMAAAIEQCERVVEDHASGAALASEDTLASVAGTLRTLRELMTTLVQVAAGAADHSSS